MGGALWEFATLVKFSNRTFCIFDSSYLTPGEDDMAAVR